MSFIDREINRFQNGVNNRASGDIFNSMRQPDPTIFSQYNEDFHRFAAAEWNISNPNGGTGTAALVTTGPNQVNGKVAVNTSAVAGGDTAVLKLGNILTPTVGQRLFCKIIANLSVAADPDVALGFTAGTGEPADPEDGIWWRKSGGSTSFDLIWTKDGGEGSPVQALGLENQPDVQDGVDFGLAFYFDGIDSIWGAIDGTALGRATIDFVQWPDDKILTPTLYISNDGITTNYIMNVDLFYSAQERAS